MIFLVIAKYQALFRQIKEKAPTDPIVYSNPEKIINIPFPYLGTTSPVERFAIKSDESFDYMGREGFAQVLAVIESLKIPNGFRKFHIYGSIGYGKSHILAAMACLLFQQGKRVVYLPDCRAMAEDFLEYFKRSLLTTFGDSEHIQLEILGCNSVDAIMSFCKRIALADDIYLYFIIDQLNALDYDETQKDKLTNDKRKFTQNAIDIITSVHFAITSASANYQAALHMQEKQTSEIKVSLFGGLTEVWNFFVKLRLVIFTH